MDVVLISGFSTVIKACKEAHRNEQLKRFVAGMEAKVSAAHDLPPIMEADTPAAPASMADPTVEKAATPTITSVPKRTRPGTTPSSPVPASGGKTINLTAVATASMPVSPPPSSPKPAAAQAVPPSVTSIHDPESGPLKQGSSLSRDMRSEMAKVTANIREQEDLLLSRLTGKRKLRSNAAIVTFNTEQMRAEVCKTMPSGWWASLFMRRDLRMSHGGRLWKLWVRRAAAPDDYRFENMSTRIRTNILIQMFTGFIMFTFIVICAAFITWLSAASSKEARIIKWDMKELRAAIGIGMAKIGSISTSNTALDLASYDAFCASSMASCIAHVDEVFPAAAINMTYGAEWSFSNATVRLLNERPIRQDLTKCAESVSCPASYCMPCYCLGLSSVSTDDATPEFLAHIKDACSTYWRPLDLRRQGIMIAISVVIAVINSLLTIVLRFLKFNVEKHWTTTDTELSYAIWSYLVKLINSVAVLLIVNCSTLGNLQKRALEHESRWMQRLILDGLFDDFTPNWYASIGFSVLILMMINVAGPLILSSVDVAVKLAMRAQLLYVHMGKLASPEDYNAAFRNRQFTLEERISDVLFNLTLAFLFGSGMPLCYLIVAVYVLVAIWWDRLNLLAWRQPAQRYQTDLPIAIMYLLPVLLMGHCAFGLWMHTYFKAELSSMDIMAAANAGLVNPGISSLSHTSLSRRITQPNGLPLLIWFLALGAWLIFGRWILWAVFKIFGRSCTRLATSMRSKGSSTDRSGHSDVSYEEALSTTKVAKLLRGPRTYRISHLTNYKAFLSTGAAARLWSMVQGDKRFTRLTTFRVHVEMEVHDGHQVRTEEREVEMFDVADAPIKSLPNAAAALAAAQAAAARDDLPLTPQLPLPPSRGLAQTMGDAPKQYMPPPSSADTQHPLPSTDSALLGLVPSAGLQAATLQHIATLQANTGALVKRVSLRAMPEGLLVPGHGSLKMVAPSEPLPPFELDLQPVVVRSLASIRLLPVRDRADGEASLITAAGSEPAIRMRRSSSAASASSSHASVVTTQSAPPACPTGDATNNGGDRDGTAGEITMASKDSADDAVTEAAIVVQAEAVVLAEAVAVAAIGSKGPVKRKSGGGSGIPKNKSSTPVPSKDCGPRSRATFKYKAVPLEQLSKQTKASSVAECLTQLPPLPPSLPLLQQRSGMGEVAVAASVAAAVDTVPDSNLKA
ncbi:hypothetical protein Vretifemale_12126 [Volvox reticuliferus]|nr:hypothetical protein Vretifemale_12126 [Volvox reticuliferus]